MYGASGTSSVCALPCLNRLWMCSWWHSWSATSESIQVSFGIERKRRWCSVPQRSAAILDIYKWRINVQIWFLMVLVKSLGNYILKTEFDCSSSFMSWCTLTSKKKARRLSFSVSSYSFWKVSFREKQYWNQSCWYSRTLSPLNIFWQAHHFFPYFFE